ncbi:helix-turn-helix domain-containing protein [Candidatus Woesearchaeota archaeon]|nr:helix-turn-helix domain-containing protein [Candidatus Woesearchaeota archaeon]
MIIFIDLILLFKGLFILNAKEILKKLKEILNVNTNIEFAEVANVPQDTLNNWIRRDSIPFEFIYNFALLHSTNLNFIYNFPPNHTIITNSLLYRIKIKKEAEFINRWQDVILILHRSLSPLSSHKTLTFKQIKEAINSYNVRVIKDILFDFVTNKSKIKAINFLEELENEEQDFIIHNLNTFLNILWESRIPNHLGIFTFDTPPTT